MISAEAADRMESLIADATGKGGKLVVGGTREGTIFGSSFMDHVTRDMTIYREESFGPVKPIIRVDDDDEALRVASDTENGLAAAVFSQDIRLATDAADRIESGICHINGPTVVDEA